MWLKVLMGLTITAGMAMMVMSGARGPSLGVIVGGLLYLLLCQRKALLALAVLLVALYFLAQHFAPKQMASLEHRVTSIANTAGIDGDPARFDASNWIRLQLWKVSTAHSLHKLEHEPLILLFGSGPKSQIDDVRAFYDQWTGMPKAEKERLTANGYPTNEMHNMYLDANGKMGLLWTLGNLFLIVVVVVRGFKIREPGNQASLAVGLVSVNFLVTGMTYDLLPHWATFFLVFLYHAGNT